MSRLDPKTTEEAFVYQFEDEVKVLKALSRLGKPESFEARLRSLENFIKSYRQVRENPTKVKLVGHKIEEGMEVFVNKKRKDILVSYNRITNYCKLKNTQGEIHILKIWIDSPA